MVMFTKLVVILERHPSRMRSVLREARVINDPGPDRFGLGEHWRHDITDDIEHCGVRPIGLRHEMMHRLMRGP